MNELRSWALQNGRQDIIDVVPPYDNDVHSPGFARWKQFRKLLSEQIRIERGDLPPSQSSASHTGQPVPATTVTTVVRQSTPHVASASHLTQAPPHNPHGSPHIAHTAYLAPMPHLSAQHLVPAPQHLTPPPRPPPATHVAPAAYVATPAHVSATTVVAPSPHFGGATLLAPPLPTRPPAAGLARPVALVAPVQPVAHVAPARPFAAIAARASDSYGGQQSQTSYWMGGLLPAASGFAVPSAFTPVTAGLTPVSAPVSTAVAFGGLHQQPVSQQHSFCSSTPTSSYS